LSLSGAKSRVQRARVKLRDLLVDACRVQLDERGTWSITSTRCGRPDPGIPEASEALDPGRQLQRADSVRLFARSSVFPTESLISYDSGN
jgi:hypothetical protein